jgi:importin subunit alpha-1
VVEAGTVPHLCNLLLSPSANVREQAAWCLGNIAGDGAELRDHVLQCGALPPLLQNVLQPASISMLRNTVWALSNFCRGKPQPALATVAAAVPVLAQIMAQQTDKEVLMDACWAMSYLSDGENARVEAVVQTGVMGRLVQLLGHESPSVITPALRTVGNIVSGDDKQTQSMVDAGCVRAVLPLLGHVKKGIRKEACWMLSNIAAGTHDQITALLQHRDVMDGVLGHVRGDEWDVRKEAAWVLSNVATGGTHEQVFALVKNHRCVEELCSLLDCADVKILQVALDALEALLKCDSKSSGLLQVPSLVDEADGLDKLENLQEHENQSVYEKAVRLIETYFGSDDDEEGENIAPASDGATFSFGLPAAGSAGMAPKLGEGFGAGFPAAPAFNAAATFNANSFNFNVAN